MRVTPEGPRGAASEWQSASSNRSAEALCALILAGAILVAACGQERREAAAEVPQPASAGDSSGMIESPSMEFLPRREEVPGWQLIGDPRVYPGDRLRSYIGRQSQQYLAYDVVDVTVGEYERTSGDGRATLEIYRFPDFVKAFGAYSTRRVAVKEWLALQNESFLGPHSIHVWRGPFYLRMTGTGDAEALEEMKKLVGESARRMPPAPGKPAVFEFFPQTSRVKNGEGYSAGPVFGQPYLAGGFTAKFEVNGLPIEGVILPAPTREVAAEVLGRFQSFFSTNGRLLDPIPNLGEENFVGEDRFMGRVAAFRLDRFVVAFNGFSDKQQLIELAIATDQRILNSIRAQLQAAERATRQPQRPTQ